METPYANLRVYTTGSNMISNPVNYTITGENTTETITLKIVSEYSKPLLGDLIITFTDPNPGFLGTSLPVEYGYAMLSIIVIAIAAATGYLYLKRKK
jgi:hypothetical protein